MRRRPRRDPRILVPTAVTLGTAIAGFAAVLLLAAGTGSVTAGAGVHTGAAWLIFAAWVFDTLDGPIARLTVPSAFGVELDALCDVIAFGLAPALLASLLALREPVLPGPAAPILGTLYLIGAVVRLARFNTRQDADAEGHLDFRGLPSPLAALVLASLVLLAGTVRDGHWLLAAAGIDRSPAAAAAILAAVPLAAPVLGLLMVSTVRYPDLPKHYVRGLRPRWHLAVLAAAIAVAPGPALAAICLGATVAPLARLLAPGGR